MSDLFDEMGGTDQPGSRRDRRAHAPREVKASRRKHRVRTAFITGFLMMILSAAAVVVVPNFLSVDRGVSDYPGPGTGSVTVTVPEGATGREIASILKDADVVATTSSFIDAYNADSRASSIQPGTFTLKLQMSAAGAVTALLDPANKANITVTIPEGFTTWQVYDRLASALSVDSSDVEEAAAGDIGLPAEADGQPEGWYAPLTYTFEPDVTAAEALSEMVSSRISQLEELSVDRSDWQSLLIKASIIEREGNSTDFAQVARVIENRLVDSTEVNGYLQMDSTVLYGLGKTGGVPTSDELAEDTPFNTYLHKGLPPTPIGSAGLDALDAAVNPAEGDWLYFVTVNLDTGETKFAATLAEHNENVQEFREWLEKNPQS